MRKSVILALSVALSLVSVTMTAQKRQISGKVVDSSTGEPVPFASIQLKGTMLGGSADADGAYTFEVPQNQGKKDTLVFSSIGYRDNVVPVGASSMLDIELDPDTQQIQETIVVAFGTATKESFTGSATVVKSEDIAKVQSSDVTRSIEGMVAGVQMTTSSGSLGSSPSIMIRGISSINAGVSPLFVVDGVPYAGDMNNINPSDIESMTVLKDAASNALYGARGANGVIMITTKKAKIGNAVINVDAKWGLNSKALREYDYITDPAEYYEAHYAALYNNYRYGQGKSSGEAHMLANAYVAGPQEYGGLGYQVFTVPAGQSFIGANGRVNPNATLGNTVRYNGKDYLVTPDSWLNETYRRSLRQEYNVSVSGTTGNASIFASFGYLNNKAIIDGSDMERYTARVKVDYQAMKWFKLGVNAGYTNFTWNNGNSDEGSSGSIGNVFGFASSIAPIYPVYLRDAAGNIMVDERGMYMYDYGTGENGGMNRPVKNNANPLQSLTLNRKINEGNAFNGSAYAEFTLYKGLKFTFNAGTGIDETRATVTNNPWYGQFASMGGTISKSHGRDFYLNLQQLLTYDTTIAGEHHISALVGHESYKTKAVSLSAAKSNLFSIENLELDGAVNDSKASSSSMGEYNNEGYLARFQYDWRNRVFASVSYRRDASSRFHPDHRWGNFWSLGAGWIINDEPWFNAPWIDMLKLKASYGSQGNDNIGSYRYVDTYEISQADGGIAVAFRSKGNPNITWETNANFNTGIDFGFWRNRLSGSVEYFYRKTTDMLFFFKTPESIGYAGYYDNIGDMRNAGIELSLNANIMSTKNFDWNAYFNLTHYTNKVLRIPEKNKNAEAEGHRGYANGNRFVGEGLPLNTFRLPKYAGVDHETGESLWYMNVTDNDGNVTGRTTTNEYAKASYYLCDDPTPKVYGGFGTSLEFFGVDVSMSFTYSIGGLTYDSAYAGMMSSPVGSSVGSNYHKDIYKAWTPENKDSNIPRWQYGDQYTAGSSDRFLTDASYLNFQNAQVGYTLPRKMTQKIHVNRLRIYLACDNIYYWSRRRGLDPRYSFSGDTNNNVNSPVRTLSAGINIIFN